MKFSSEQCNELFDQLPIDTKRILICVITELNSATEKHPKWPKDSIHGAAIVSEEAGELIQAALQYKYEKKGYYHMVKEAIQTAAMGVRFAINHPELKKTKELENIIIRAGKDVKF